MSIARIITQIRQEMEIVDTLDKFVAGGYAATGEVKTERDKHVALLDSLKTELINWPNTQTENDNLNRSTS